MANLATGDIHITISEDGRVVFRLPVDGRKRSFYLDPIGAIKFAVALSKAAVKLGPRAEESFERVVDINLLPYQGDDTALLVLISEGVGPCHFMVDAKILQALASAAEAALRFSQSGGSA